MLKVDLPDGWHPVPGDGNTEELADTILDLSTPQRFFAWAYIESGIVTSLAGWYYSASFESKNISPDHGPFSTGFLSAYENKFGKDCIGKKFLFRLDKSASKWDGLFELK